MEERRRDREVSLGGEAVGHVLDVPVDAERLLDNHDRGTRVGRRTRDVGRHRAIGGLDLHPLFAQAPRPLRSCEMISAAPSGPPPASRRRTSALPTMTPSADLAASAACSGFEMPTPRSTGRSVTALSRSPMTPA